MVQPLRLSCGQLRGTIGTRHLFPPTGLYIQALNHRLHKPDALLPYDTATPTDSAI
jgi:hypothetical protein